MEENVVEQVQETTVNETTQEAVETAVVEEVVEVEKAPVFETMDDYNKLIQSTKSKAKGDILKEIGLGSVEEIKKAIANGTINQETLDELTAIKAERDALLQEKVANENAKFLQAMGIPTESGDLFLKLVDEEEGETREEKAEKVKAKLSGLFKVEPEKKIGKTKTNGNDKTLDDQLREMKKL